VEQIAEALSTLAQANGASLATRVAPELAESLLSRLPAATHHASARCVQLGTSPQARSGKVAIVFAGTADQVVAAETSVVLDFLGIATLCFGDVGVAGLHRLLDRLEAITESDVIITIAGFEGALPSVLAGLVRQPVIAVPTSTGYGSGLNGLAALLAMLNSCAGGVTVVNIDNGVGAALAAARILSGKS
jgi:NCAIR mutase (PurE)-related protein